MKHLYIINGTMKAVLEQKEIEAESEEEARQEYLKMLIGNQVMVIDHQLDTTDLDLEDQGEVAEKGVQ